VLTDDVRLNRTEAGLLIDAAVPWVVHQAGRDPGAHPVWTYAMHGKTPPPELIERWRVWYREQARAKRVQRAWLRLAALGLVRVGRGHGDGHPLTVIERTDAGTALLARRGNELGAIAERENGAPVSKSYRVRVVFWRAAAA
jgi:hypothetical protein